MANYMVEYFKVSFKALAEFRLNFIFEGISMILVNSGFYGSILYLAYSNNGFGEFFYNDILLGLAIFQLSYIIGLCFFRNMGSMQERIINGTFDQYLSRPINSYLHLLFGRIDFTFIGEFITFLILLILLNNYYMLPFIIFFSIFSAIIINLSTMIVNCIPFFIDMNNEIESVDVTINFGIYPPSIFNDFLKFVGLFIFPGIIVGFGPVMILKNIYFAWIYFGFIAILITAFAIIYNLGLKKYRSAGY